MDYFDNMMMPYAQGQGGVAAPVAPKQQMGFATPAEAANAAHVAGLLPQISEQQRRAAMVAALNGKEQPQHTTGAGGFLGAIAQGVNAFHQKQLEDKYEAMLAALSKPMEAQATINQRASGVSPMVPTDGEYYQGQ
jgi:poly(3-hydroxybutyrate) depolymerase